MKGTKRVRGGTDECSVFVEVITKRHFEENFTDPDVDNLRIDKIRALIYPQLLLEKLPATSIAQKTVISCRKAAQDIIQGRDSRLIVVIGPCSIHDPVAAYAYAQKLREQAVKHEAELLVIMRVYFEKPRTTVGWKGLINDPMLDNSFEINRGLHLARQLLLDINNLCLGVGCEFLDSMIPQYIADLVSWGAIGARTTESQLHRELASGLSMPVGFKNGTSGDIQVAVDACRCAIAPHSFLGITKQGLGAIVHSKGNFDVHIILRGGQTGPNYWKKDVTAAADKLKKNGVNPRLIVDCSHGNSLKDHKRQAIVCADLCDQIKAGETNIVGVMIESHLNEGGQSLPSIPPGSSVTESNDDEICNGGKSKENDESEDKTDSKDNIDETSLLVAQTSFLNTPKRHTTAPILNQLKYGVSITDKCIGWTESESLLALLAEAVRERRLGLAVR